MDQRPLFGAGSRAANRPRNQRSSPNLPAVQSPVVTRPSPQPEVEHCQPTVQTLQQIPVQQTQQQIPDQQIGNEEDRKEPRNRALKGGLIVFPGKAMSTYGCKIRNESRGGVMLVLSDSMLVPSEFYLVRDADPGHKIPCRVAWRGIGRIGVQFVAGLNNP